MYRNQVGKRRLCAEFLEPRQLLTGNVSLKVIGGNLFMTGDDASNSVTLAGTATPGKFIVTGSAGTKIDGKAAETVTGVNASVIVNLNGGDDTLKVNNAKIKGDLNVDMGTGKNSFNVNNTSVGGSLISTSVNGTNTDVMDQINVSHDAIFSLLGSANQNVTIDLAKPGAENHVGGSVVINTGSGDDTILESSLTVGGADVINTDSGNDSVDVAKVHVASLLKVVKSGTGEGELTILGTSADQLLFIGVGTGNNFVQLGEQGDPSKNSFRIAQVFLGAGDDKLEVHNTTVSLIAVFDGGPGTNLYQDDGGNHLANLVKVNLTSGSV